MSKATIAAARATLAVRRRRRGDLRGPPSSANTDHTIDLYRVSRPMRRSLLVVVVVAASSTLAACVPPREHVDGRSADGRTAVDLDLHAASGDSVMGTGTVRVAGRPRAVVLRGKWDDKGDGVRHLAATLQADTMPGERWALEWSPLSLDGTLRRSETTGATPEVALTTR
jgi:hypothetical protein